MSISEMSDNKKETDDKVKQLRFWMDRIYRSDKIINNQDAVTDFIVEYKKFFALIRIRYPDPNERAQRMTYHITKLSTPSSELQYFDFADELSLYDFVKKYVEVNKL